MTLKTSIETLMRHENLTANDCKEALIEMLSEEANTLQTAAFLALLRTKKETSEELSGLVMGLKEKMKTFSLPYKILDIVGTGGDAAQTVNISTGSAIIAASCGVKIVKHGNRAVSSLAGSADVLEALGVNIHTSPEKIHQCVEKVGIGFCFSPDFHPVMLKMRTLRKALGIPTTFNLLGPLLNPAHPDYLILGVMDPTLLPVMSSALQTSGIKKAWVVHGCQLDEISCVGAADVFEIEGKNITKKMIHPEDYGFKLCHVSDLRGGKASENAHILKNIFSGKTIGPVTDTLILNAAIAVWLYGLSSSIDDAIIQVKQNVQCGAPLKLLSQWVECSHD